MLPLRFERYERACGLPTVVLLPYRPQHLLRRDGEVGDADSHGVLNGVGDGGGHASYGGLANALALVGDGARGPSLTWMVTRSGRSFSVGSL